MVTAMRSRLGGILLLLFLGLFPAQAYAQSGYTVTGTIRTPAGTNNGNNQLVKYIRVHIMDEDLIFDDTLATGYADAAGNFSIAFTPGFLNDTPDIFVDVEYVGTAISGRFIEVRSDNSDSNPIRDVNVEGTVHTDQAPGVLALGVLRVSTTRANIITEVGDAMRYLQGQYAGYNMPNNLRAEGRTTNGASFVSADGSHMSVAQEDYDDPGPGGASGAAASSDIHHETFHWVAYRSYGNRWPNFNCSANPHSSNKESCEGFAMQEGSAQYFGSASSRAKGIVDQKNGPPSPTDWRGSDGTGSNNSGEIVEGALERTWGQTADAPGILESILVNAADSMEEFKDGYATLKGATSAQLVTFLNNAAIDGMVYTRGRLDTFAEGDPPDAAPPSDGNYKVIDNIVFLRGKVKPTISQLNVADTPLAANSATVAADQKDLGHKAAAAGLAEASTAGFTFIGPVPFANDLEWDTSALADGDYDLIIRLRNIHTWQDSFQPDFTGDSNAATNSNERWLKTKQTWFNQDKIPSTDDEGKAIVDNSPPAVSNFKP